MMMRTNFSPGASLQQGKLEKNRPAWLAVAHHYTHLHFESAVLGDLSEPERLGNMQEATGCLLGTEFFDYCDRSFAADSSHLGRVTMEVLDSNRRLAAWGRVGSSQENDQSNTRLPQVRGEWSHQPVSRRSKMMVKEIWCSLTTNHKTNAR